MTIHAAIPTTSDMSAGPRRLRSMDPVMWMLGIYVVVTAVAPYMYGPYLAPVVAAAAAWALLTGRMDVSVFVWTLCLSGYGFAVTAHGVIAANAGALATMTIHAIQPLLLGIAFGATRSRASWHLDVQRILDTATVAVAGVGAAVYFANLRGIQLPAFLVDPRWMYADIAEGMLRTNYQGYNSLVLLAPYAITRFFDDRNVSPFAWRVLLLTSATSGLFLSGRRILYISVPISILAVLLIKVVRSRRFSRSGMSRSRNNIGVGIAGVGSALATMVSLAYAIGLTPLSALERIVSQFSLGAGDERMGQREILLDAWSSSLLIGHGAGATIPNYVRNMQAPWAFELSYHSLLFNFGLVGFILLLSWGLWTLVGLARGAWESQPLALPLLAGYGSVIIAIYVDPYVQKFDGMWMLFVPFVAAGLYRSRSREAGSLGSR